jgi:PKD repeat protein
MEGTRRLCRRLITAAAIALAGLILSAAPCFAINVIEAWRVPFDSPSAVSVDPDDGSCVFASAGDIIRLAADGSVRQHLDGTFDAAAVNVRDDSFWATTTATGELTHVASNGGVLWQGDGYDFLGWRSVRSLDINPTDGSVWFGEAAEDWDDDCVHHLAANGTELWTSTDWMPPVYAVSVNPSDGSCWVSSTAWFMVHFISHYSEDGTPLWTGWAYRPLSVSVDSGDGSVWYTDGMSPILWGYVIHLAADGSSVWSSAPEQFGDPYAVAANPRDGSCWVGDRDQLIYLAAGGSELWRAAGYGPDQWGGAGTLAVNPRDGSCRLASVSGGYVARLDVVGLPEAAFVARPAIGPASLTVHFQDWSLGTPTAWLWSFGDGATSAEQNPTHTYAAAGAYAVTLSVSNGCGCDTACDCVTVVPPQCATRTPGYWFTHPEALLTAFAAIAGDEDGVISLCDDCLVTPDDAMAIFWLAHGLRVTFAQHLLAAMFNGALLKPVPDGIIENAMNVLCNPEATNAQLSAALAPLAAYNQSGSSLSMIGYDFGSADPAEARAMAADGSVPDCVAVANGANRRSSASSLSTRSTPSARLRRGR